MKKNKKLTPNFVFSEFLHPSVHEVPEEVEWQLVCVAQRLQAIRDVMGLPMRITSGYRTVEHNARIGGHPHSYHLKGMAADVVVDGLSPAQLQKLLAGWSGGLGSYETFTHVDIGPKRRW